MQLAHERADERLRIFHHPISNENTMKVESETANRTGNLRKRCTAGRTDLMGTKTWPVHKPENCGCKQKADKR
jgi:hypothetical protein